MRRFHQELTIMRRRALSHLGAGPELGRLRKHHPGDCGRARCGLCHPSKRWHTNGDRARDRDRWQRDWHVA